MKTERNDKMIAIEEHYVDDYFLTATQIYQKTSPQLLKKLMMTNEERIADMDNAEIDIQVLSHNHPGAQVFDTNGTLCQAEKINNRLSERIEKHSNRFRGLASLPMHFPHEAARELERCVTELGFLGAMLHGNLNGEFFDKTKFWPVFEMAAKLDKPIYIHPGNPHHAVKAAYYNDYEEQFPIIQTAGWGFGIETSTAAVRLILSQIFDQLPSLKIILGHMGEGLPFLLERCHSGFSNRREEGKPYVDFRHVFSRNFFITTSGNFSNSALICSIMEIGTDKILFAVDWPYNDSKKGAEWIRNAPISAIEKQKITHKNAMRLFGID